MKYLALCLMLGMLSCKPTKASKPISAEIARDYVIERDWLNKNGYANLCADGENGPWWPARHMDLAVECWESDKVYFEDRGFPRCPTGHNCELRMTFVDTTTGKEIR